MLANWTHEERRLAYRLTKDGVEVTGKKGRTLTRWVAVRRFAEGDTAFVLEAAIAGCQSVYPTQVTVGAMHACALMNNGTVYCWGGQGHLGDGSNQNKTSAVQVSDINNATQIVAGGGNATFALLADKTVKCWGDASDGALGSGAGSGYILKPQVVAGISNVSEIQTDGFTVCALVSNAVSCWGRNADALSHSAIRAMGITNVKRLGEGTTCAIFNSGSIQCWSGADGGPALLQPSGLSNVSQLSRRCALSGGKVYCWAGKGTSSFFRLIGSTPGSVRGSTSMRAASPWWSQSPSPPLRKRWPRRQCVDHQR